MNRNTLKQVLDLLEDQSWRLGLDLIECDETIQVDAMGRRVQRLLDEAQQRLDDGGPQPAPAPTCDACGATIHSGQYLCHACHDYEFLTGRPVQPFARPGACIRCNERGFVTASGVCLVCLGDAT